MSKIMVTGGNGQLASCIKDTVASFPENTFLFKSSTDLDICEMAQVDAFIKKEQPIFCINCAGFTAVDMAESAPEKAKRINEDGARNLALACAKYGVKLIHISTDFVFDGTSDEPYLEEDKINPLGVYAQTKANGELAIRKVLKEHFIIRTSWLYGEHGHNFMKTMLRLGSEKKKITVVDDQQGSPTYAGDLANCILQIINKNTDKYGTYHYSNLGSTSWFGFAKEIFDLGGIKTILLPTSTAKYPTPARRPPYSVLNTDKIRETFQMDIPFWKDSLAKCLKKYTAE